MSSMRSALALLKTFASVAASAGAANDVSAVRTARACSAKDFGHGDFTAALAVAGVGLASPVASVVCVAVLAGF